MAADRDDRYFGLVRSQDEQPGRRFRDVLRTQALPVTQPVTMLTDGGDSVAGLVGELSPGAVHIVDWFRATLGLSGSTPPRQPARFNDGVSREGTLSTQVRLPGHAKEQCEASGTTSGSTNPEAAQQRMEG